MLKSDDGSGIVELHTYFFECSEHWCTINELGELWTARIDLIEEVHTHSVDLGGIDEDYDFLQILGNTIELKFMEIREDEVFWWNSLHPLSTVEDLYIEHWHLKPVWGIDVIKNIAWLELLLPFIAVKNLYLSSKFVPAIIAALQELIRVRKTEKLPNLQNILVKGLDPSRSLQENLGQFVASWWLSGCPVTISVLDKLWDDWWLIVTTLCYFYILMHSSNQLWYFVDTSYDWSFYDKILAGDLCSAQQYPMWAGWRRQTLCGVIVLRNEG